MKRSLAAIVVAEALLIAVLAYFLLGGREGARGDRRPDAPEAPADAHGSSPTGQPAASAASGPASASPRPPLDSEAVLWGRVWDRGGSPPREGVGWVTLRAESGESRTTRIEAGSYAMAAVQPGTWTVIATVRGWKSEERTVEIAPGASRIDFELEVLARIPVRFVTPAGAPLVTELPRLAPRVRFFGSPLYAVATGAPPGPLLPMTELRVLSPFGAGEWVSSYDTMQEKLPKGVDGLLLVGEFPVYASAVLKHLVLRTTVVQGPVDELVFTIPADEVLAGLATVRARFVDALTGAPIRGVHAGLNDRQSGGSDVQTDGDGRAVFEQRMPGLMYLTLSAQGYEAFQTYVPIRAGGDLDIGTFRVAPVERIQGRVLDEAMKPVRACSILLRNVEHLSPPQPLHGQYGMQTDAEGVFHVQNAGRARYLLVANAKGYATHAQVIDVPAGGATGLEIRLTPGVQVTVSSELPTERHCLLTVTDERGTTFSSALTTWRWPVSWRLAAGAYRLTVRDDDGVVKEIPFTVGSKPLTLDLE